MLTSIRKLQRGILIAVTIVICIAFGWLFNKVDTGGGVGNLAIEVNGKPYRPPELAKMVSLFDISLRELGGSPYNPTGLQNFALDLMGRGRTIDRTSFVVHLAILREEAKRLGIEASDEEIDDVIRQLPSFMDQTGQFSNAVYADFARDRLGSYRLTTSDFRELIGDFIKYRELQGLLASGMRPSEWEIDTEYRKRYEMFEAYEIYFSEDQYRDSIEVTEEEIEKYYEENKELLRSGEKRVVHFIKFLYPDETPEEPVEEVTPPEEETTAAEPEAAEEPMPAEETEAEESSEEGKTDSETPDGATSEEPKEGECQEPEQATEEPSAEDTPEPSEETPVETAVAEPEAAEAETAPEPTETETEAQPTEPEKPEITRNDVGKQFNKIYAEFTAAKEADPSVNYSELAEKSVALKSLEEEGIETEVYQSPLFERANPPKELEEQNELLNRAFAQDLLPGESLGVVNGEEAIYLVWVDTLEEPSILELEEAREEIVKALRQQALRAKVEEAALKAKESIAAALGEGKSLEEAAKAAGVEAKPVDPFTRFAAPEDSEFASVVARLGVKLDPGKFSDPYSLTGGSLLVFLQDRYLPVRENAPEDRELIAQSLRAGAVSDAIGAWFQQKYIEADPRYFMVQDQEGKERPASVDEMLRMVR